MSKMDSLNPSNETSARIEGESGARIEQRWNANGDESWCIIDGARIIGFGAGDEGKKSCESTIRRQENLKTYTDCPDFTLLMKPKVGEIGLSDEERGAIRKEFEGCITEIGANKTLATYDDYNKGWNDASDHAIKFIRRYIKGEGLFQL